MSADAAALERLELERLLSTITARPVDEISRIMQPKEPPKIPGRGRWICANRPNLLDRFHELYSVKESGCWEWNGDRLSKGYGRGSVKGVRILATHMSLFLHGSPRPSQDHYALHSCDNPPCVNPAHLRWGTNLDNTADRVERGRNYRLSTFCIHGHDVRITGLFERKCGRRRECLQCMRDRSKKRWLAASSKGVKA